MGEFVVGANLPWLDYGQDFGASAWQPRGGLSRPERRERLRRALGELAASGASLVRWWLLGDGRAGLSEDGDGRIAGLDDRFLPDVDAAVEALREAGLRVLFVLVDFLWLEKPRRRERRTARGTARPRSRPLAPRAPPRARRSPRSPSATAASPPSPAGT